MDKSPKIELQLNQTDKILELIGWIAVFGSMSFDSSELFGIT